MEDMDSELRYAVSCQGCPNQFVLMHHNFSPRIDYSHYCDKVMSGPEDLVDRSASNTQ